jgi:hypothetical protein
MVWAVTSLALGMVGCGGTVIIDPGNNGGNGPDDDTVILRIQNSTRAAVRPQIYVGTNGADATADNLFVPENIYTNGVGLAGSGLMAPVSADDVEVPCFADLVIGTPGGEFLDDETGESLGSGPRRILQQGLVFDCGAEITLTFRETEDGYTTTVELN